MIPERPLSRWRAAEFGFTMIELLVYMIIAGHIMAAVFSLLISQSRMYSKQREIMDVHGSLRDAAALLSWELRQASAAGGDLYSINANSVALRSIRGTGVVCVKHATQPRYGIWAMTGEIEAGPNDSALVLNVKGPGQSDDQWSRFRIILATAGGAPPPVGNCVWNASVPQRAVRVQPLPVPVGGIGDTAGVRVGALFTAFRRVEYGIYLDGGRWWLGRKVGGAVAYEKLTGPLMSAGGLEFTYRDAAGAVTAIPALVSVVEFVIRAESYGKARSVSGIQFQQDTLAMKVLLRGE